MNADPIERFNAFPALRSENSGALYFRLTYDLDENGLLIQNALTLSEDKRILYRLRTAFREIYEIFQNKIVDSGLCLLCAYEGCSPNMPKGGGFTRCIEESSQAGKFASAIAVSVEAVRTCSDDRLILILLHELTHALWSERFSDGSHADQFHNVLDALIFIFNQRTGLAIQNDYNQYSGQLPSRLQK